MKILIVEDDKSLREIIQRALTDEGYVVENAATYFEGCDKIAGYSYDCILLDIMLPDGNGIKLLQQIKQLGKDDRVKSKGLNLEPTTICQNRFIQPSCWHA